MATINNANPREALTFDDVLIRPGLSEVLPGEADIRSKITRSISVNIPIIASARDTPRGWRFISLVRSGTLFGRGVGDGRNKQCKPARSTDFR